MATLPLSVPAPVTGWNTRDSLDAMAPTDAVTLDNWYPTLGKVTARKGYSEHITTGLGSSDVDTLAEYHAGAVQILVAAADGKLFDASSSAASALASGFTNNQWQTANFNGYMLLVNGADAPQIFDGSTMSAAGFSGSGLTPADLDGVAVFKNRLFFWDTAAQDFWYGTLNAISGVLTKFPLSRVAQFGGNLIGMASWTHDGGDGVDDYAVFVMSSGDVIVYSGTDPGDASAWSLVGVYHVAEPLSVRGLVKVGGDLMLMTTRDYVSLTSVMRTGQVGNASKLAGAVESAVADVNGGFGYQATLWPKGGMMVFNVPSSLTDTYYQHVINMTTGAACRFTDVNARCWGVFNDDLYFGSTDGKIYKFWDGYTDNGSAINADGVSAWNSFGAPERKRCTAIRPVIQSSGNIDYSAGVGFDFRDVLAVSASSTSTNQATWDVDYWDVTYWASESVMSTKWVVRGGTGQTLATRMRVSALQEISWLRTDYRLEKGRNL